MEERLSYDVVIVGAGPSGLAAGIRLKQLANESGQELSVCILEKGSEVGAHILSGAVIEPRALDELLPEWREDADCPLKTEAKEDHFLYLTNKKAYRLPTPKQMKNHGNYIASLGLVCRWMAGKAEALGVEIFPGFPAKELQFDANGKVTGVLVNEFGRGRNGEEKAGFQPSMAIDAKFVLLGEGCRGSITRGLEEKLDLRADAQPQTYGIGIKELWQVAPEKHQLGKVVHTVGWPLDHDTYGGSFMYHLEDNQVAIGFVIGLDYENPYLNPFKEFQQFKHHPAIKETLEGGTRISYGARALNEGGFQSIPELVFPGGALIGCAAGFLNVPKIKGSHTAMKSGMLAAEAVFDAVSKGEDAPTSYPEKLKASWVYKELYNVRNIRPAFRWGLWAGIAYAAFDTYILQGKAPWTFKHVPDHATLKTKDQCIAINYPAPDGQISFDLLSSVYLSSTNHEEDQPIHLTLKDINVPITHNLEIFDAPETRYCPAGVYEIVEETNGPRLQINAQNCVHCKTCDIKDPTQNIVWTCPEGGGGPNYSNM